MPLRIDEERKDLSMTPLKDPGVGSITGAAVDAKLAPGAARPRKARGLKRWKKAVLIVGGEKVATKVITEPHNFAGFAFDRSVGPGPATLHAAFQGESTQ